MIELFSAAHRRAVPLAALLAGRGQRLHLRRHGEHHRHHHVRARPARRARRARRHLRRPDRARARAPVVRRLRHLPRLVARLAQRGLRHLHASTSSASTTWAATSTTTASHGDMDTYLREAGARYQRPIVCHDYDAPIDLFDRHLYEKGGLVLHMLRRELGDDAVLARACSRYLHQPRLRHRRDQRSDARARRGLRHARSSASSSSGCTAPATPSSRSRSSYEDGLVDVTLKQAQKPGDVAIFAFDRDRNCRSKSGHVTRHEKHDATERKTLLTLSRSRSARCTWLRSRAARGRRAGRSKRPATCCAHQLEHGSRAAAALRGGPRAVEEERSDRPIDALDEVPAQRETRPGWCAPSRRGPSGDRRAEAALQALLARATASSSQGAARRDGRARRLQQAGGIRSAEASCAPRSELPGGSRSRAGDGADPPAGGVRTAEGAGR